MPIASAVRTAGPFAGGTATVVYAFDFKVFTDTDLYVVVSDAYGAESALVLTSDYTVDLNLDQDADPGGEITLDEALAAGETMVITSTVANLQPTDLTNQGGFYPSVITDSFDRSTIQIQQLQEQVDRSIKLQRTSPTGVDPQLPNPEANYLIGWNATANGMRNVAPLLWDYVVPRGVSVADYGAVGDGVTDCTTAILDAIHAALSGPFHSIIYFPAGRYIVTDTLSINSLTDTGLSTNHRNVKFIGEGGISGEGATEIRLNVADAAKNGLEILSVYGASFEGIAFTSSTAIKNVVYIGADASPSFSGAMVHFEDCYFNSFVVVPAESVVQAINNKLVSFSRCWFGVLQEDQVCLLAGGNEADNADYLQLGRLVQLKIEGCYIFGVIAVKNLFNFEISNNTFNETFGSRIEAIGDEAMHGGIITNNFFSGLQTETNANAAIVLGNYTSVGGEQSGCISISHNRFRYRDIGIDVDGATPVIIENNHFRPKDSSSIGMKIQATAEKVTIGSNDFDDMYSGSALAIDDLRYTPWTDQPTGNVDKDIVADFVLAASDTNISATNDLTLVGSVTGVKLRGGKYRVRMSVTVRNTDAVDSMPFLAQLKYRDQSNAIHSIGIMAEGFVGADDGQYVTGTGRGTVFAERIVNLKGTSSNNPANSAFLLYVSNHSGAATPASGLVLGAADETNGSLLTWFQVEEYRD